MLIRFKEDTMSDLTEFDYGLILNRVKRSLKPKGKYEKITGFITNLFVQKCAFHFRAQNKIVSNYLFHKNKDKLYDNSNLYSGTSRRSKILAKRGVSFTVTGGNLPVIERPILLHLGKRAWLFIKPNIVNTGSHMSSGSPNVYFTGKNVIPYIHEWNKIMEEYQGDNQEIYEYSPIKKEFISIGNNKKFKEKDYIIDDDIKENVFDYLNRALLYSKKLYRDHSVIRNPGIILYGKPGTGKSTFIKLIASKYHAETYFINLKDITGSINALREEIKDETKTNHILCFEDIDVMYNKREDLDIEEKNEFNTLLQFLDGASSIPNSIKIATTNHIERLDDALTRPGRFSLSIEMKDLNEELAQRMCRLYNLDIHDIYDGEFPVNPSKLYDIIVKNLEFKE